MRGHMRPIGDERGSALVVALMAMLLLSALGMALVMTTMTESKIAGNYSNAEEGLYAADAGLEVSLQDLLTVPDWNSILAGTTTSAFIDGVALNQPRILSDGSQLNLIEAQNMANCAKITTCSASDMN